MSLSLQSFQVSKIGEMRKVGDETFAWAIVYVSFEDTETRAKPSMELEVPIHYEHDWSVERVRQAAYAKTRETLEAATALLDENNLEQVQQLSDEYRNRQRY